RRFPAQRFEDAIVACLWAGDDAAASHETALAIYELADVMPANIHVTVPQPFRGRRTGVTIHHAAIGEHDRTTRAGVPVTTVERTIVDVMRHSGTDLAAEAAEQALATGLVTSRRLRAALNDHGDIAPSLLDLASPTA
ncbi:MAG: hypothetical protein WD377_02035, partial [Nitriliruptoraceae bacterium]